MKMTAPMEVGLTVTDLPRMRAFYEAALDVSFVSEVYVPGPKATEAAMSAEGYTAVRLQTPWGERVKLLAPDIAPKARSDGDGMILAHQSATYLTFIVDDIAGVVARVRAAGGILLNDEPVTEVRPGVFLSFLRDPEGHILEIVSYADVAAYRNDLVAR
ncbi:VOC family protein [Paenirhodobacter populi]|uniref:VOC family protein n=1 Tax=Paenirhodobacter populi TaxID=2306993 RepID=UPI0019D412C0|nr:VOC family protein [Sinirhodobacter populi]